MKSMKLLLSIMMVAFSMNAFAGVPAKFPVEGRLTLADGSPMLYASTQIRVQIRSTGAENCLLYSETFPVNLSSSDGRFSVMLNAGVGTVDTAYGWTFQDVFKNTSSFSVGSPNCTSGSSYTPAAGDTRNIVIMVHDGTAFDSFPAYALGAHPYSLHAGDADSVGGVSSNGLLQTNTTTGFNLSQSNITGLFADASWAELQALIAGTSTKYAPMTSGSLVLGTQKSLQMGRFSSSQEASFTAALTAGDNGKMWYNTTSQTMMIWNGTSAVPVAAGGSGVTSVSSSNAYLSVTSPTTVPTITANVGTAANTLAAGNDSRIVNAMQTSTPFAGDVSGLYGATIVNRIQGYNLGITSPTSGQYLRYNGTNWTNSTLMSGDVNSALGYLPVNRAGDSMTGYLTLSADPISSTQAATKQYVDSSLSSISANMLMTSGSNAMTGPIRAYAGNPSMPGYTFATDTNTGMFLQGPDALSFAVNGQSAMEVNMGSVAIPMSSLSVGTNMMPPGGGPLYVMSQFDPGTNFGDSIFENQMSGQTGPTLQLMKTRFGGSALTNDFAGTIRFSMLDSSFARKSVASIESTITSATSGSSAGMLKFSTMGANTLAARMVIDQNGNVGIGTTTPAYALHLQTDSAAKPGTSTWTIASDVRLKDIGQPFTRGLEALDGIETVYFHYKAGNPLGMPSDKEYVGIRAQDVQKVVPEAVKVGPGGYLHVTNDAIHWTVFNAVKELYHRWTADSEDIHDELEALKAKNAELEMRLQALEAKLAQ